MRGAVPPCTPPPVTHVSRNNLILFSIRPSSLKPLRKTLRVLRCGFWGLGRILNRSADAARPSCVPKLPNQFLHDRKHLLRLKLSTWDPRHSLSWTRLPIRPNFHRNPVAGTCSSRNPYRHTPPKPHQLMHKNVQRSFRGHFHTYRLGP